VTDEKLKKLQREVNRLRAALVPFARLKTEVKPDEPGDLYDKFLLKLDWIRTAAEIVKDTKK